MLKQHFYFSNLPISAKLFNACLIISRKRVWVCKGRIDLRLFQHTPWNQNIRH